MNNMMIDFKDIYKGQTIWIVGKGPSLQYLKKEDFGQGPIITINQAIIKVEELDLPNPTYSMQKDGGDRKTYPKHMLRPDCEYTPNCNDKCGNMYRPKRGATLLIHKHESLYCFPDYSPRYVFDWKEFGLRHNQFSVIISIRIGILMGCIKFHFVSCDVHTTGSLESYIPNVGVVEIKHSGYEGYVWKVKRYLRGLDYKYITPKK